MRYRRCDLRGITPTTLNRDFDRVTFVVRYESLYGETFDIGCFPMNVSFALGISEIVEFEMPFNEAAGQEDDPGRD
jgi:hypothetical protein